MATTSYCRPKMKLGLGLGGPAVVGNNLAKNSNKVGISDFDNNHTGQGSEGGRPHNVLNNEIYAEGGSRVGISNFGNCTPGKNDDDDAAAGGSGDQGHKRAPRSSAPASNNKSTAWK
ncbi:hypothetical protein GBA52_004538 [Prunus armeniaca]|nr:hypothetical protein GBA52_004538 [Prunus armeniaca]